MKFIKEIIKRNWFQEVKPDQPTHLTFTEDINALDGDQLQTLCSLYKELVEENYTAKNKTEWPPNITSAGDFPKNTLLELEKLLYSIMISEFKLDNYLYWPQDQRNKAIKNIAENIGWPSEVLVELYERWHSYCRKKVMD